MIAAISFLATMPVHADVLNMKSVGDEPPNTEAGVLRPKAGLSMDKVKAQFGEPVKMYPAVGEPPITRWVYDEFTVYFEHQYVIHSVVNKK
jgi:hypothetical protein